jgi:hypothetical protein
MELFMVEQVIQVLLPFAAFIIVYR